jgi:DNA-binding response OmpR family regulator
MAIKVLVVDDEQNIADSVGEILESHNFMVRCAYSGQEAIRQAMEGCPDILLSDILMPGLNGFEAALEIGKLCSECRLLFFSGQAATVQLALDFGFIFTQRGLHFELLPKPLHPDILVAKIRAALVNAP